MLPFFLLLLIFTSHTEATIKVNGSTSIACTSDTMLNTPLEANVAAIQQVLMYCMASPRCAELYGQSNGAKLEQFSFLLETTTEFIPPLYLETPVFEYVCQTNATLQELNAALWLLRLELDILATGRACGLSDEPLFDETTQTYNCVACASCKDQHYDDWYTLFVIFAILAVVGIFGWLGVKLYEIAIRGPQKINK